MFWEPEKLLQEIGVEPELYSFRRFVSPVGFKVNGVPLAQFPILCIERTDLAKWFENFWSDTNNLLEANKHLLWTNGNK